MNKININFLDTEQINKRTSNISNDSTIDIALKINYEDSLVANEVKKKIQEISKVIDMAYKCILNKGRIIYIGAGTSGRIGFLDAAEIYPTFGVDDKIIALIAGGNEALFRAKEGCEDDTNAVVQDLQKINLNENDIVIGISASGRTPYVISGIKFSKNNNAKTVLICNIENPVYKNLPDVCINVTTGPEVIAGSTRMKAGTSQKMICNMISTGVMIKLGYVEQNYMINLVPTNKKLEQRCKNIIKKITNETDEKIEKIFNLTRNVKLALLMIQNNFTLEEAKKKYKEIYGK